MRTLVAALILVALTGAAPAATEAEKNACHADAIRLCPNEIDSLFAKLRVFACFLAHRGQLSPQCSAVLKSHGY